MPSHLNLFASRRAIVFGDDVIAEAAATIIRVLAAGNGAVTFVDGVVTHEVAARSITSGNPAAAIRIP